MDALAAAPSIDARPATPSIDALAAVHAVAAARAMDARPSLHAVAAARAMDTRPTVHAVAAAVVVTEAGQAGGDLRLIPDNREDLVAAGSAQSQGDVTGAEAERLGKSTPDRLGGFAVDGWRANRDYERRPVRPVIPPADAGPPSPGPNPHDNGDTRRLGT